MSRPQFDDIVKEFERLCLDEQLFWQFKNDEDLDVCVTFRRNDPRAWAFWLKLSPDASKQTCSSVHVSHVLQAFRVNEKILEEELFNTLLVQAAYADEFIHQVGALVGTDAVRNSISQTQNFIKDLGKTIENLLNTNEEGKSSPIVESPNSTQSDNTNRQSIGSQSNNRQHLRIIKK